MNTYMSGKEKEFFVRMTALEIMLKNAISEYAGTHNNDKEFLKNLRMSHTFLLKAIQRRKEFLNETAWEQLMRQFSRLELMFVPSDKTYKEYQKIKELKTHLNISIDDFNDWYCEVIGRTCQVCNRKDYKSCTMRKMMQKYQITAFDLKAKGKCQYSYL